MFRLARANDNHKEVCRKYTDVAGFGSYSYNELP